MPDFSGASLKLKALDEDKVLATLDRIDKKGQAVVGGYSRLSKTELDKASAYWDEHYGKASKAANKVADVSEKVNATLTRQSRAVDGIARGFEMVARTGGLTGRSLDSVAIRASELALGFGPNGYLVGAALIGVGAMVESIIKWDNKLDETKAKIAELGEEYVKLGAEADHNQLGTKELARADAFLKQIKEIQKNAPTGFGGVLARGWAELLAGAGAATGSQYFMQKSFDAYAGRVLGTSIATRQAGANLLKGDANDNAEDAKRKADEQESAVQKHISSLASLIKMQSVNGSVLLEADRLIAQYTKTLNTANLSEEKRVELLGRIKTLTEAEKEGTKSVLYNPKIPSLGKSPYGTTGIPEDLLGDISLTHQIAEVVNPDSDQAKADKFAIEENVKRTIEGIKNMWFSEADQLAKQMQERIGQTIGAALESGFAAAFEKGGNIGKGITALTKTLLAGLGSMFAQIAEKALIASQFMQKIVGFLTTNPWLAAAAAAAMLAFASSLGGGNSGSGGGGYSGSGSLNAISTVGTLAPQAPVTNPSHITPRPSNTYNVTVIGKDAKAWREVQEQLNQNARRG